MQRSLQLPSYPLSPVYQRQLLQQQTLQLNLIQQQLQQQQLQQIAIAQLQLQQLSLDTLKLQLAQLSDAALQQALTHPDATVRKLVALEMAQRGLNLQQAKPQQGSGDSTPKP